MVKYLQRIKLRREKGLKGILLLSTLLLLSSVTASAQYYRTKASGASPIDWYTPEIWEVSETKEGAYIDLSTNDAVTYNDAVPSYINSTQVVILNEHSITISSENVIIDQLVVEGTLTINSGFELTILHDPELEVPDLIISGLLVNEGYFVLDDSDNGFATAEINGTLKNTTGKFYTNKEYFKFNATGTYDHAALTTEFPLPLATWEINSTIKISALQDTRFGGNTLVNSNQTFSNLIWDTPQLAYGTTGNTAVITIEAEQIRGNFIIKSTGTNYRPLRLSKNLQVDKDLSVSGGYLRLTTGGSGTTRDVEVRGNIEVTGGTLDLNSGTSGITNLNVLGNFNYTGGGITKTAGSTANINFNGSTNQLAPINRNFTGAINFSVAAGSVLDLGETSFIGTTIPAPSNFTVQTGGTVKIGSADGINTSTGNIKVPQTYSDNSTIVFTGTGAQVLGTDFPATAINVEINNAAGVTMDKNLTIAANRTLALTNGNLNIASNTLTLNGNIAGPDSLGTTFASNLMIGGTGPLNTLRFSAESIGLNNLTLDRLEGSATLGETIAVLGQLNLANGTLILDKDLALYGTAIYDKGALSANPNTFIGVGVLPLGTSETSLPPVGNINLNFSTEGNTINTFSLGTLANATTVVNLGSDLTINESLFLLEGNLNKSDVGALTLADNSTVYLTNGTINFEPAVVANGAYNLFYYGATASPGNEFTTDAAIRDLTIGGDENRSEFTLTGARTVGGDLTVFNGDFAQNFPLSVAGDFIITKGVYNQNAELTLKANLTATAEGSFISGIAPVTMAGNTPQTIAGNFTFQNLTINNNGNEVLLSNNINVENELVFSSGIIRTGDNRVFLGNTGFITGETDANRLLGNIQISKTLTAGSAEEFGNIGIVMSADGSGPAPGSITVNRNTGNAITAAVGTPSIKRLFDINGPESGMNITMTLRYLEGELNGNDESTLTMYKSTVPAIWTEQKGNESGNEYTRNSTTNEITLTGVKGFSTWTMASPNVTLPVDLTYFTAKKKGQSVELIWETGLEIDSKGFEVQVSTNAVNYRKIGFVSSKNQNSRSSQKYTFTDAERQTTGGSFYYRLRQLNNNGEE